MAEPADAWTRRFPELTGRGKVFLVSPKDARGNVRIDGAHGRTVPEVVLASGAHMTATASNGNLYVTFPGTSPDGPGYEYVDAEVRLPAGWHLEASLGYLHAEAAGTFGQVDISSETGRVTLRGERESARVVTGTGDISVDRADNLTAISEVGDIEYDAVSRDALNRINARSSKGEVVATVNGEPVPAAKGDGRGDPDRSRNPEPGRRQPDRGDPDRRTPRPDRVHRGDPDAAVRLNRDGPGRSVSGDGRSVTRT